MLTRLPPILATKWGGSQDDIKLVTILFQDARKSNSKPADINLCEFQKEVEKIDKPRLSHIHEAIYAIQLDPTPYPQGTSSRRVIRILAVAERTKGATFMAPGQFSPRRSKASRKRRSTISMAYDDSDTPNEDEDVRRDQGRITASQSATVELYAMLNSQQYAAVPILPLNPANGDIGLLTTKAPQTSRDLLQHLSIRIAPVYLSKGIPKKRTDGCDIRHVGELLDATLPNAMEVDLEWMHTTQSSTATIRSLIGSLIPLEETNILAPSSILRHLACRPYSSSLNQPWRSRNIKPMTPAQTAAELLGVFATACRDVIAIPIKPANCRIMNDQSTNKHYLDVQLMPNKILRLHHNPKTLYSFLNNIIQRPFNHQSNNLPFRYIHLMAIDEPPAQASEIDSMSLAQTQSSNTDQCEPLHHTTVGASRTPPADRTPPPTCVFF